MEWAPQINTLTLFDITGEPAVEGQEPPECQICYGILYNPELFPSEITTCHHRFHRDCLRNQWCNNNAGNTLAACRCPTCQQIFNCDTQLQDLTPQVNARLQQLQQPAVVEAQGLQVEQAEAQGLQVEQPQFQQIPENNLQTYTRQNYLIDRAIRRFTDCITQILRDIPPPVLPAHLNDIPNHHHNRVLNNQCNSLRIEYFRYLFDFIKGIVDKYKYFQYYLVFLGEIINILNIVNDRLQDNEFIRGLIQNPNGIFRNYRNHSPISFVMASGYLLQILTTCYNDADPDANNVVYRGENGTDMIFIKSEVREFINTLCERFTYQMGATNIDGSETTNCVNIIPIRWSDNAPYINPDLQFFQRYIQCFLDFLTALLEVNYNQAFQQQGGKRNRKTRKQKRNKKMRKTKRNGKK